MSTGQPKLSGPLNRFDPLDYRDIGDADQDGVHKLHTSLVAPLVASARGYQVFTDDAEVKAHVKDVHGSYQTNAGKSLRAVLNQAAMLIPLYPIDAVYRRTTLAPDRKPTKFSRQYKPANPQLDKDGRRRKYHLDRHENSYIDVHPSTPSEWIDDPQTVLITEGIIKGDSALTAMLRASGVTDAELFSDVNSDRALHDLMLEVPKNKRVLILSLIGVQNFKQNTEWNQTDFRDSSMWLAFDGDAASNLQVWKAANSMLTFLSETKHVDPDRLHFVDLSVMDTGTSDKLGIDDFLSDHGTWKDLNGLLVPDLPPQPPKTIDDEEIGTVRMTEDGTALVKIVADEESGGRKEVPLVGLGGRIKHTLTGRTPTSSESTDWVYDDQATNALIQREVAVEVIWRNGSEDGSVHPLDKSADTKSGFIIGPVEMLNYPPDRWATTFRKEIHMDLDVLRHQAWPPPNKSGIGEDWLSALKKNRYSDQMTVDKWNAMGWVPVKGHEGRPQFVLGSGQIIGENGEDNDAGLSISGVDESTVKDASKFHLDMPAGRPGSEEYNASVKEAIEEVMDLFVVKTPWHDERIGPLILSAALRPVIPTKTNSVLFFVGAPKSGKALPLDQELPVPEQTSATGFKAVSDIVIGDEVFSGQGATTSVRNLSEIHSDRIFALHLADGREAEMSARHILSISTARSRSLAAHNAARNALDGTDEVIEGLRSAAAQMSSGSAAEQEAICVRYGLSRSSLAEAIEAANVPSMDLYAPDESAPGRTQEVYLTSSVVELSQVSPGALVKSATITAEELSQFFGITDPTGQTTTAAHRDLEPAKVYPVSESLLALADLLVCGIDSGVTLRRNVTAEELAGLLDDSPALEASPEILSGSREHLIGAGARTAGADFALRLSAGEVSDVPTDVRLASSPYRRAWLSALIDSLDDIGTAEHTSGRVRIKGVASVSARTSLADLVRSLGRTAMTFASGDIVIAGADEGRWAWISGVRDTGREELVRCLTVSHHTGTFLTEGYVPTHNSWSAAQLMQFWSDKPSWDHESLPGSAEDTNSATEIAMSKTPVWIIDDLAPSADSRKADTDQSKVSTIVRLAYNNSPKQRANADMRMRESLTPKALTVITAENDLTVGSAMNRTMTLTFKSGSIHDELLEKMVAMNSKPYPSRITAALIQLIASREFQDVTDDGDRSANAFWRHYRDHLTRDIQSIMGEEIQGENLKRQAQITADIMLTIAPLRHLAEKVGVEQRYVDMLSPFDTDSVGDKIISLSRESFSTTGSIKPGESLLAALRDALASGKCHMRPLGRPGDQPFSTGDLGTDDVRSINEDLGWDFSGVEPRGRGDAIGWTFVKNGRPYLLFNQVPAFDAAQRLYPERVPHGQKSRASWNAVWSEDLATAVTARKNSGRDPVCLVASNKVRNAGIPISLATFKLADEVSSFDQTEEVLSEDLS